MSESYHTPHIPNNFTKVSWLILPYKKTQTTGRDSLEEKHNYQTSQQRKRTSFETPPEGHLGDAKRLIFPAESQISSDHV